MPVIPRNLKNFPFKRTIQTRPCLFVLLFCSKAVQRPRNSRNSFSRPLYEHSDGSFFLLGLQREKTGGWVLCEMDFYEGKSLQKGSLDRSAQNNEKLLYSFSLD